MSDEIELAMLRKKLARATNAVHPVSKDATVNLGDKIGNVSYATIGQVLTTVKAALQAEGLSLQQPFTMHEAGNGTMIMSIDTLIMDSDTGSYLMFSGPGFPVKGDPQAAGGAITYFRRYALVTLFGLIVDDDDGTQATRAHRNPDRRTEAEGMIRDWLATQDKNSVKQFAAAFKDEFNSTLTELPIQHHGDALTFQKEWAENAVTPAAK